ncbi:TPA: hypothetical protein I7232_22095 [Vibrio vulnificus]|nr:hypothetical protein [Vibrio vulnificus]HDY7608230.1 hypothetical protein [Vibrio vulnificus]
MSDIETYEDRLEYDTGEGVMNAEFATDQGVIPAMVQLELTDVVKRLNDLDSINGVQKKRIKEQLLEHWEKIKEHTLDCLQSFNPNDGSITDLLISALSKYFEYETEVNIVIDVLKYFLLKG